MSYKQKQNLIRILVIVVAVALVFGAVRLFSSNNTDDGYSKTRIKWTVGGLDETGAFDDEPECSMVSQAIEIGEGFKIVPDFNKSVSYQVYVYDEKDNFMFIYEDDEGNQVFKNILEYVVDEFEEGEIEPSASHFRIVITPNDKDGEIKLVESWKYAGHISVYELEDSKKK